MLPSLMASRIALAFVVYRINLCSISDKFQQINELSHIRFLLSFVYRLNFLFTTTCTPKKNLYAPNRDGYFSTFCSICSRLKFTYRHVRNIQGWWCQSARVCVLTIVCIPAITTVCSECRLYVTLSECVCVCQRWFKFLVGWISCAYLSRNNLLCIHSYRWFWHGVLYPWMGATKS